MTARSIRLARVTLAGHSRAPIYAICSRQARFYSPRWPRYTICSTSLTSCARSGSLFYLAIFPPGSSRLRRARRLPSKLEQYLDAFLIFAPADGASAFTRFFFAGPIFADRADDRDLLLSGLHAHAQAAEEHEGNDQSAAERPNRR